VKNGIDEIFFCILMSFIENFYCKNFDGSHYGYGRNKIQVFYGRDHTYFLARVENVQFLRNRKGLALGMFIDVF
jgi:hypothetical protein